MLAAVAELGGAELADAAVEIQAADGQKWVDFARLNTLQDEFLAALICGAIYLSIAFGLHAAAWNYWAAGDYKRCAELCQRVAVLAQSILGKDDATVADCKYYLAETLRCTSKLDEAISLYKEADRPMSEKLGSNNAFRTDVLFNLGRCYEEKLDYKQAQGYYKQALADWAKAFGSNNMICAKAQDRLAALQFKNKELNEAKESAQSALRIDRAYGSKYDATIASDLNDLAVVETASGDIESALKHLKEAQALQESGSADKYSIAAVYINQAHALLLASRAEEALASFNSASRLLAYKTPPAGELLALKDLEELSSFYASEIRKQRQRYEVPNFDSRAEITFTGDGNI